MSKILDFQWKLRRQHPNIDNDIKTILANCRDPQSGMCLRDIRAAYQQLTDDPFPISSGTIGMTEFLLTIPYVAGYCNTESTLFFYRVD